MSRTQTNGIVTRSGDRITKIRFEVQSNRPMLEYAAILADIPDSKSKREWVAKTMVMDIKDGWAEVVVK